MIADSTEHDHSNLAVMYHLSPILRSLGACGPALKWLAREKHPTFADAWKACPNLEWMCWLIGRTMTHREVVALVCDLAEPAFVHTSDPRPAACIATVRRWVENKATLSEVRGAAHATTQASNEAKHTDKYCAADAAGFAGDAVEYHLDVNYAANCAIYAADAAYDAVAYATQRVHAKCQDSLQRSRDIILSRFPAHLVEARLVEIGRKRGCLEVA